MKKLWIGSLVGIALSWVACTGNQMPSETNKQSLSEPTQSIFSYPTDGEFTTKNFYDFPYPSDMRLNGDGRVDLKSFPNPKLENHCSPPQSNNAFVDSMISSIPPHSYLQDIVDLTMTETKGFSPTSNIYFRFSKRLSSFSIPSPAQSLSKNSPIFLMNIDPKSPFQGEKVPVFVQINYTSRFLPDHMLVVRPADGFPLRPNTRYAAIVLDGIRDAENFPLEPNQKLAELDTQQVFANDPSKESLRVLYAPLFSYLKTKEKISAKNVLAATIFTVGNPIEEQEKLAEFVTKTMPNPELPTDMKCKEVNDFYVTCQGTYKAPLFQKGAVPYLDKNHGMFEWDKQGQPIYTMVDLRFSLTLPKIFTHPGSISNVPMPVVMYSHGTGGDYETPLGNGVAEKLAKMGIATFAIDQVGNGERTIRLGTLRLDFLFFNALNLRAARDNVRQSGLDYHWQLRFLKVFQPEYKGLKLSFDPKKIWFMGHSQGGLIGPLFLALDQESSAAFLSAPGGYLVQSLLHKKKPDQPIKIPDVMSYMLCDNSTALNSSHPILSLFQHFFDPADPINYVGRILSSKRTPIHFFMTEGTKDNYATPEVFEPLVVAMGLPLLGKEIKPIPGLAIRSIPNYSLPVSENYLHSSGKKITVGFTQHDVCLYSNGSNCDGHFVTFYNEDALQHWQSFFQSLVLNPSPTIH